MKKPTITVVIAVTIVVIVIAIASSALFNPQNSNQPTIIPIPTIKPITDVYITDFYFDKFFPAEGLCWHAGFVIEITNNETQSVDELTLAFSTYSPYNITRTVGFYNNSLQITILPQKYVEMGQPCLLGSLEVGETKTLHGYIHNNLADNYKVRGYDFDVKLRINDIVLDTATIMIP